MLVKLKFWNINIRGGKMTWRGWRIVKSSSDIADFENLLTTLHIYNLSLLLESETNLKVRNSLPNTASLRDNIHELSEFDGKNSFSFIIIAIV